MPYPVDWVDAFTTTPFGGNGCAVVHNADGLSPETCRAFTRETGLVECTFLGPSDKADVAVRYFMPTRQIPFAGHPTIATVASMLHRGLVPMPGAGPVAITLETGAGVVPVEIRPGPDAPLIVMTQNAPVFGAEIDPALVARIGGIEPDAIVGMPQVVSTGLPFVVTILSDRTAVQRLRFDPGGLPALLEAAGMAPDDVLEPYWIAREGATDGGDTFARLLLPPPMPPEDAFTGSATGCAGAYLWHHGLIDAPRYIAGQGHGLGRPGQAQVEVLGPPEAISGVRVGGTGRVVMSGDLLL